MLSIKQFVFNELSVNSFVLYDAESRQCMIIDPGCHSEAEFNRLSSFIEGKSLMPCCILNTHGHFDHIMGNADARMTFGCPLAIHQEDLYLLNHMQPMAAVFGIHTAPSPLPDVYINDGQWFSIGKTKLKALHVPGHSPGSICLYCEDDNFLIGGDVLFSGSIGRTDLPGGNHSLLLSGIRGRLFCLPRETVVYTGHGPATTIGSEQDTNPFFT